jgi:MFS family permease
VLDRNFRLLFAGRAISYVGTYLAPIAVAFAILDLGASATAVGLSFAAWTLAQVLTLAIGGVVGDRLPRRMVMIASDVCSTAVRVAMGVLLVTGNAHVWELIALQACGGAAVAFYNPTFYGLVREIVPTQQLQQANSYLAIARYAAFPLGAATGGAIVASVGAGTALLFDGGTYALSALLLSFVRVESIARAGAGVLHELREGWSAFVEHQWVWVLCLWIALYFLITYAPFFVLGPYIAKHSLGGAGAWAAIVTGEGIGALLGGLVGLRVQPRHPWRVVCPVFALSAVQSLLLAAHAHVVPIAAGALVAGFSFSYGSVMFETGIQRAIAPHLLGRVSAYTWMAAMTFLPLGYATAGWIGDVVGMSAYLVTGAVWIVVATCALMFVPEIRDFRLATTQPADVPAAAVAT